jgi:hypothetical protein
MLNRSEHDAILKHLTDQGRLIAAGFEALRFAAIPTDAPGLQVEEMRNAFFAGAQHLFASITSMLDPGIEPTENDLNRMTIIEIELNEFEEQFRIRYRLDQKRSRDD